MGRPAKNAAKTEAIKANAAVEQEAAVKEEPVKEADETTALLEELKRLREQEVTAKEEPAKEADETAALLEELKRLRERDAERDEQFKMLQAQIESVQAPRVVQVMADTEKVHFLWQCEVAADNIVTFGEGGMYGRIVGKTGSFYVPKSDMSRVLDGQTRTYLDNRWLIVVSGLDDEERDALGVNYREGELLDRNAFAKLVELGNGILEIYPSLCAGHREMVASRFYEAWHDGSPYVTRELAVELNRLSKEAGSERGDFTTLIEEMNDADAKK